MTGMVGHKIERFSAIAKLHRDAAIAGAIFVGVALALWWIVGQRLLFINDEGIWLDGARRILAGQVPYRDFFTYLGPGAFWNTAAAFRVFGVTLGAARALAVAELAVISACLYWMTAKLGSRAAGLILVVFYFEQLISRQDMLAVNHRWESAALSVAAGALLLFSARSRANWSLVSAGALVAYAAWTTPSMVFMLLPMLAWAGYERKWTGVALFAVGAGDVSAAVVVVLISQGAFLPMLRGVLWAGANYSDANRFTYGEIFGGYAALFKYVDSVGMAAAAGISIALVWVPILAQATAALGLAISRRLRNARMLWLAGCALAALAAVMPRPDPPHLAYSMPFACIIAACVMAQLPGGLRLALVSALCLIAAVPAGEVLTYRMGLESTASRVGIIRGNHEDIHWVRQLEQLVAPGESFFAFPYIPLAYFLTEGANPTRYSYLQPGMMNDRDEETVLSELQAAPPQKVLYYDLTSKYLNHFWPNTDPRRMKLTKIERWLKENYRVEKEFSHEETSYQLLLRAEAHKP